VAENLNIGQSRNPDHAVCGVVFHREDNTFYDLPIDKKEDFGFTLSIDTKEDAKHRHRADLWWLGSVTVIGSVTV